jgi:glycosyltransferase involved in cell wall biosynthesis
MPDQRPLLTFALIAYNQEQFIAEAVQGAFSQTYSPLEIILSDDCSPDRTFEIMQEMAAAYSGPHTIVLNRNEHNLGLIGHINRVMEMVQGELIVVAAGDDVSLPHRTKRICEEHIASGNKAVSLFSNAFVIDETREIKGLLQRKRPKSNQLSFDHCAHSLISVHGSTHAWHRHVFEFFGPLNRDVGHEDVAISFRSGLIGEIRYIDEPLIYYRRHMDHLYDKSGHLNFNKYREESIKKLERIKAIYSNRLDDLTRMFEKFPDRRNELIETERLTKNLLQITEDEIRLSGVSWWQRLIYIWESLITNKLEKNFPQWRLVYWFPRLLFWRRLLYLKIQDYNISRKIFYLGLRLR